MSWSANATRNALAEETNGAPVLQAPKQSRRPKYLDPRRTLGINKAGGTESNIKSIDRPNAIWSVREGRRVQIPGGIDHHAIIKTSILSATQRTGVMQPNPVGQGFSSFLFTKTIGLHQLFLYRPAGLTIDRAVVEVLSVESGTRVALGTGKWRCRTPRPVHPVGRQH